MDPSNAEVPQARPPAGGGGPGGGGGGAPVQDFPVLYSCQQGTVQSIQTFGAFVQVPLLLLEYPFTYLPFQTFGAFVQVPLLLLEYPFTYLPTYRRSGRSCR
jgi:hypothetical protein